MLQFWSKTLCSGRGDITSIERIIRNVWRAGCGTNGASRVFCTDSHKRSTLPFTWGADVRDSKQVATAAQVRT